MAAESNHVFGSGLNGLRFPGSKLSIGKMRRKNNNKTAGGGSRDEMSSDISSNPSSVESPHGRENGGAASSTRSNGVGVYDLDLDGDDDDTGPLGLVGCGRSLTTSVLDAGRLLRVTTSTLDGDDLAAFRRHWQQALPVVVSLPDIWYRADIWRPSALARCGGSPATDPHNGLDVAASRYWDQFDRPVPSSKTPSSSSSSSCSKDWPSADDLSAFTTHLRDLDAGLPLPDYTRLGGVMHCVSHLPEYFVRPELSTLRIVGLGASACGYVSQCSRLRIDMADTVNTAVFVNDELHDFDLKKNSSQYFTSDDDVVQKKFIR